MDSFEINKIAGAVLAALLVVVASNVFMGESMATVDHAGAAEHGAKHVNLGYDLMPPEPAAAGASVLTAISPRSGAGAGTPAKPILAMIATANPSKGKKVFKKCKACHTTNKGGKNKIGPNLWNVIGRNKAAHSGFKYSTALKSKGGAWSYGDTAMFLRKPKAYVAGTKMTFTGIKKSADLANLMAYLRSLSDKPLPLPR